MAQVSLKSALDTIFKIFLRGFGQYLDYHRELDESPPRARIALATARFEEALRHEILRRLLVQHGVSRLGDLSRKKRDATERMLRRSTSQLSELGWALGIFPYDTLENIKRVLKVRNEAVHRTERLTKATIIEVEKGVIFLGVMDFYLANVGSVRPEDGPYPPPDWQDVEDYYLKKQTQKENSSQ